MSGRNILDFASNFLLHPGATIVQTNSQIQKNDEICWPAGANEWRNDVLFLRKQE